VGGYIGFGGSLRQCSFFAHKHDLRS
jgi:hypothetical protein